MSTPTQPGNTPEWLLVVFAALTLLVFIRYAWDTYRIARASVTQTESSQMPFLAVGMREATPDRPGGWTIANQGFGPALNIRYSIYDAQGTKSQRFVASLGKEDVYAAAHQDVANAFVYQRDFEIDYQSLSGRPYRTIVRSRAGQLQTEFFRQ